MTDEAQRLADLMKIDHAAMAKRVLVLEDQLGRFYALTQSMRGEILAMVASKPREVQVDKWNGIAHEAQRGLDAYNDGVYARITELEVALSELYGFTRNFVQAPDLDAIVRKALRLPR